MSSTALLTVPDGLFAQVQAALYSDCMSIGARIRSSRKALRMSQQDLAAIIGVTDQAISNWERDKDVPKRANLQSLAEALKVEYYWLLDGASQAPPTDQASDSSGALTTEELNALLQGCVMLMAEKSDAEGADLVIQAIVKVARQRKADVSSLNLDSLRELIRATTDLSRSGLLR